MRKNANQKICLQSTLTRLLSQPQTQLPAEPVHGKITNINYSTKQRETVNGYPKQPLVSFAQIDVP
jgi:hypothetical protein